MTDFTDVTELAGEKVSHEQIERLCHRYYWAGELCRGKDVLEAGCGSGQGLGYIAHLAQSLIAGDFSEEIIDMARRYYGDRIALRRFDAQDMPFENDSFDVVILFEAIYYLLSAQRFTEECKRVLKPGGKVLITSVNKDLYDYNPSPHAHADYGVRELFELFSANGFSVECFGSTPVDRVSMRQKFLRPAKKVAVALDLIPKTMKAKKILKRVVFGKLVPMPCEITEGMVRLVHPSPIPAGQTNTEHKVIYCAATLRRSGVESVVPQDDIGQPGRYSHGDDENSAAVV